MTDKEKIRALRARVKQLESELAEYKRRESQNLEIKRRTSGMSRRQEDEFWNSWAGGFN